MKKILYVASSYGHILSFHIPYIEKLQEMGFEVHVAAAGANRQIDNNQNIQAGVSEQTSDHRNPEQTSEEIGKEKTQVKASEKGAESVMFDKLDDTVKINLPFEKNMLSLKNFACAVQLVKLLKKEQYDIISVHTSLAAFFVRLAVMFYKLNTSCSKGNVFINKHKKTKKPLTINTVHGYLFDEDTTFIKKKILLCAEKLTKPATEILVVMNEQDYEIAEKYKLYKDKLVKIPGVGIDTERFSREKVEEELVRDVCNQSSESEIIKSEVEFFRSAERAKLGINSDDIVLIYAAEFSKRKNQRMLIEAMPKLPSNLKLFLAGKGEQLEKCKKIAERLTDRVEFLGHVKNLEYYYYISDICVSASKSEGLPFNVMEAMAMGLPVVATNVKGHQDLIEESQNGFLYDYDDVDGFVEAIVKMIDDKENNIKISNNNIIKAQKYGLNKVIDEVIEVYEGL